MCTQSPHPYWDGNLLWQQTPHCHIQERNDINRCIAIFGCITLFIILLILGVTFALFGQSHKLEITEISKPTFSYREGVDFSDSMKVEYGKFRLQFVPIGAGKKIASSVLSVNSYGDVWTSTNIRRYKTDEGVKEEIIVKDAFAPKSFKFLIKGHTATIRGKEITFGRWGTIPAPWARDDNGIYHNASQSLSGDTLIISWSKSDSANIAYPLLIDPTLIITDTTALGGYGGMRSATAATPQKYTYMALRRIAGDTIYGFLNLPIQGITSSNVTIDSARVKLYIKKQAGYYTTGGSIRIKLVRQTQRDSTGNQMTWVVYKTGNPWTTAGARDTTNDIYGIASPTTIVDTLARKSDTLFYVRVDTLVRRVAGEDSLHRFLGFIIVNDSTTGDGFYVESPSSALTFKRPALEIFYTENLINNVYAVDSLRGTNDTTGFTLDSLARNALDSSDVNLYAIRLITQGVWLDTGKVSTLTKMKYTYAQWKNKKIYGLSKNYTDTLEVWSYAENGVDSLKITRFVRTRGSPAAGGGTTITPVNNYRASGYNPIYRRPETLR